MSIPLHLVTGFLGSGKSSFLDHFIRTHSGKSKIAIIQNEFSSVNVDGRRLRTGAGYDLLEINNGSVFCVCLLGSFIDSLAEFAAKHQPDLLLMEASGLSDPIGVGQVFQSGKLKGKVYLEHVWCLVDAVNFDRIPALKLRFEHQLRSADTIVVNKADLVGDKLAEIVAQVKSVNPFARVVSTSYGVVDPAGAKRALNLFPQEDPLGRPDIQSVVIRSNREISPEKLHEFVARIRQNCFRCKGFVKLEGGNFVFAQGVFSDFTTETVPAFTGPTELVLIGIFEQAENLQITYDEYCRRDF
ncbi:CobW family GTP-binding protein [Gaoshiqia sediminis]|uniref:GTP-binding protein n=1 Tax=Gaoshiqia sediminis TaxID=2986998 RepID=A0AA41Y9N3_9BACT|nr:CobW family GTP-binding protein [Gaoshiqia sediminis]MCW0481795.1 GTP-binding protein [Gaoshiqia sediminis]